MRPQIARRHALMTNSTRHDLLRALAKSPLPNEAPQILRQHRPVAPKYVELRRTESNAILQADGHRRLPILHRWCNPRKENIRLFKLLVFPIDIAQPPTCAVHDGAGTCANCGHRYEGDLAARAEVHRIARVYRYNIRESNQSPTARHLIHSGLPLPVPRPHRSPEVCRS